MAAGPWVAAPPLAATVSLVFTNGQLVSGGNSAVFARLYYSASPTGSSPVQVGAQTGTWGLGGRPPAFPFDVTGVPWGSYIAGYLGSNTAGNTNAWDLTYFDDLGYAYAPGLVLTSGQYWHDPMLDDILASVRKDY